MRDGEGLQRFWQARFYDFNEESTTYGPKEVTKLLVLGASESVSDRLLGIVFGTQTIGGLGGGFGCWHVALAVEKASGINDEAGRVNCAEDHAVFFDLQQLGGVDVSF